MFALLVFFVILQRLWELQLASSNVAQLKRRGAVERAAGHYPLMVALHTCWLAAMLFEAYRCDGLLQSGPWFVLGWSLLLTGQLLRWWTIRTLGKRWTTRVFILPGEQLVAGGPFRWFRHPNYLGVSLEMFGLPLIGGCWRTSLFFGLLNLLLLRERVKQENMALLEGPLMEAP